jgi:hypothetical protein
LVRLAVLAIAIVLILLVNWHLTKGYFSAASRRPPFLLFLFYSLGMLFVTLALPFFFLAYLMAWIFHSRPVHPAIILLIFLSWIAPTLGMTLWNSRRYKSPTNQGKQNGVSPHY